MTGLAPPKCNLLLEPIARRGPRAQPAPALDRLESWENQIWGRAPRQATRREGGMTDANTIREAIRSTYRARVRGDLEGTVAHLADDAVFDFNGRASVCRTWGLRFAASLRFGSS